MTQPVIGLFERRAAAERAIGALAGRSVRRDQISVVRRDWAELGDAPHAAAVGLGGLDVLFSGIAPRTIAGVGTVLAVGPLVAAMSGACPPSTGAVGGELRGALVQMGCADDEAGTYIDGVRRGGTLVAVHAAAWAVEVRAILRQAAAAGVCARPATPATAQS